MRKCGNEIEEGVITLKHTLGLGKLENEKQDMHRQQILHCQLERKLNHLVKCELLGKTDRFINYVDLY